jgi:fluoroquinolone transport system permease protein
MQLPHVLRGLSENDVKQVQRDSLLAWLVVLPVFYAVVMRFLLPFISEQVAAHVALSDYYPLIVSYLFIAMTPVLVGAVVGFLLLDERDEQTLKALMVTPIPMSTYLLYRITAAMLLSVGLVLVVVPLVGVGQVPFLPLLLTSAVSAMAAPLTALFFVGFAENKVQGFAMMKIIGVLGLAPVVAYFIPAPWQDVLGLLFPAYLPIKAFWVISEGMTFWWVYLLLGVVLQGGLLKLLMNRFYKQVYAAF